jgi:hypothetical protein
MACQFCQNPADSIDNECPIACIPPLNTPCDSHNHCDTDGREFCSNIAEHKYECVACNYCTKNTDSIDGNFNHEYQIPFLTSEVPCVPTTLLGICPAHCIPPVLSPCDQHHQCDLETEFCSAVDKIGNAMVQTNHKCLPCQYCTNDAYAVGKKCPDRCIPPVM